MASEKHTPLMAQYFRLREQYPEALLLFQVGDFYELFFDDAKVAAQFLAIALTKRGKSSGEDIPLCGIPVHALRHYLAKLIKGGFSVAVCDQVSEPKPGTVVEREVTRVYTPGTLIDDHMLDEKSASYLLTFFPHNDHWALVFSELLTAQLFATMIPAGSYVYLESELNRFLPDEVVISDAKDLASYSTYFKKHGYWVSRFVGERVEHVLEWAQQQFDGATCSRLEEFEALQRAFCVLYGYLARNQRSSLDQFHTIQFYEPDDYLHLDRTTIRNLELIKNNQDGGRKNTLLSVVDRARTAMGSRTVRKWITRPLLQQKAIALRQEVVSAIRTSPAILQQLGQLLASLSDIERIIGRIALRRAQVHDYGALKDSLERVPDIAQAISEVSSSELGSSIVARLHDFSSLVELLEASVERDTSAHIIKRGFDQELDRLRDLVENAQQAIFALEQEEIASTGISSLKVKYNKVHGYAIEVTRPNIHLVPEYYKRVQTLKNVERFTMQRLTNLEHEIMKAHAEIATVESVVWERVKTAVYEEVPRLRQTAHALAYLDALYSFAAVAYENNYVMPRFNDQRQVAITAGRHPVVEQTLRHQFVANDTHLDDDQLLWILTGPNMGGKSTYLRQVALISILAQCGSGVPAQGAQLPLFDRIFTRIGSGDNVAEGKSTFLVEMEETATICRRATHNSLVILDEVGRGTSTFDGMALAQSVVEFLATKVRARCLFATHYHELTRLSDQVDGIGNYHVTCKKTRSGILFLHVVEPGVSEASFGIDVARLAELPSEVILRAQDILTQLSSAPHISAAPTYQPSRIDHQEPSELLRYKQIVDRIKETDFDNVTPREAFDMLWHLKKEL